MRWGHIYYYDKLDHANDANPWQTWVYTFMLSPLGFWFASDTTFYFGHRFWHNPILYKWSHYHHHSCRPTTSFAGNAADIFELIFTGYASAVVPVLVVPMDAQGRHPARARALHEQAARPGHAFAKRLLRGFTHRNRALHTAHRAALKDAARRPPKQPGAPLLLWVLAADGSDLIVHLMGPGLARLGMRVRV